MRIVRVAAALLSVAVYLSVAAFGQVNHSTNVTLANVLVNGASVPYGRLCAVAGDQYGNPVSFSSVGWGVVSANNPFCANVVNGAITGSFPVPDAAQTNRATPITYTFSLQLTNSSFVAQSAAIVLFSSVPGVSGTTFSLDGYTPAATAVVPSSNLFSTGSSVPSSCTSPSIWIVPGSTPTILVCNNGVYQAGSTVTPTITYGTTAGTVAQGNDPRIIASLKNQGPYYGTTAYSLNDMVTVGTGSTAVSYYSLVPGINTNTGNAPASSPTQWQLLGGGGTGTPGPTGPAGATGPAGPTGASGAAATVAVGTTTTGAPGTSASVANSGTSSAAVLNFLIPQGATGATGPAGAAGAAASVTVGSTTTGAAGSSASVSNSGTAQNAVLNFLIPQGAAGTNGGTAPAGTGIVAVTGGTSQLAPAQYLSPLLSQLNPYTDTWGLGDSTQQGAYQSFGQDFLSLLVKDVPSRLHNLAQGGAYTSDVARVAWLAFDGGVATNPLFAYEGAVNDANVVGATTGGLNNAVLNTTAGVVHVLIPFTQQQMASSAAATGTWSTNTTPQLAVNSNLTGTVMQSAVNGSTHTYTLPAGAHVAYTWAASDASAGTFTVSINGSLQTNLCTGTTTFNANGCNGQTIASTFNGGYTFFGQVFAGNAGTTNTLVVTVTSATSASNIVYDVAAATVPTTFTGVLGLQGVIYQYNNANASATAAYNTAIQGVYTTLFADGFTNLFFVDARNGVVASPGVLAAPALNYTTDFVSATCVGGNTPLHPCSNGYVKLKNIFESAAATAGFPIAIKQVGTQPTVSAPFYSYAPLFPGSPDYRYDMAINPLGGTDFSQRMPGINLTGGALNQGNLTKNLQARLAFEQAPDAINSPALKLHVNFNNPVVMCGNSAAGLMPTDSCNQAFWEGTLGNYFRYTIHAGATGNWGTSQPTPGNAFAIAYDSQVATTTGAYSTVVYLQAGTTNYAVPACKTFTGDEAGNWIQHVWKDSADTTAITFTPNSTVGDKLNGSTSAITFSNVPQFTDFFLQCSQGTATTTNITVTEITPTPVPGATGPAGAGLTPPTVYSAGTAYTVPSYVMLNGYVYQALQSVPAGTAPSGNTTSTAYWAPVALAPTYQPVSVTGDVGINSSGAATVTGINGTNLAGLATGLLKNTAGVPSIAVSGTDYATPAQVTAATPASVTGLRYGNGAAPADTAATQAQVSNILTPPIAGATSELALDGNSSTVYTDLSGNNNNGTFQTGSNAPVNEPGIGVGILDSGLTFANYQAINTSIQDWGTWYLGWCSPTLAQTTGTSIGGSQNNSYGSLVGAYPTTSTGVQLLEYPFGGSGSGTAPNFTFFNAAGGANVTSSTDSFGNCHAVGFSAGTSGTTTDHIVVDGAEVSGYGAQGASRTLIPLTGSNYYSIGAGKNTNSFGSRGLFWYSMTYSSAHTVAQMAAMTSRQGYIWGKGLQRPALVSRLLPQAPTNRGPVAIFTKDSLTAGYGGSSVWTAGLTLTNGYAIKNGGIAGSYAIEECKEFETLILPYIVPGATVIHSWSGINDASNGRSPADVLQSKICVAQKAHLYGARIIWADVIARNGSTVSYGTFDAWKNTTNALLRNSWKQYADGYDALASISAFNGSTAGSNTACYQADTIHLTGPGTGTCANYGSTDYTGYGLIAQMAQASINSLDGSSDSNPDQLATNAAVLTPANNNVVQTITANATSSLPECLGRIIPVKTFNSNTGSFTITVSTLNSETIAGSATIAANVQAIFTPVSPIGGGCSWLRTQ